MKRSTLVTVFLLLSCLPTWAGKPYETGISSHDQDEIKTFTWHGGALSDLLHLRVGQDHLLMPRGYSWYDGPAEPEREFYGLGFNFWFPDGRFVESSPVSIASPYPHESGRSRDSSETVVQVKYLRSSCDRTTYLQGAFVFDKILSFYIHDNYPNLPLGDYFGHPNLTAGKTVNRSIIFTNRQKYLDPKTGFFYVTSEKGADYNFIFECSSLPSIHPNPLCIGQTSGKGYCARILTTSYNYDRLNEIVDQTMRLYLSWVEK